MAFRAAHRFCLLSWPLGVVRPLRLFVIAAFWVVRQFRLLAQSFGVAQGLFLPQRPFVAVRQFFLCCGLLHRTTTPLCGSGLSGPRDVGFCRSSFLGPRIAFVCRHGLFGPRDKSVWGRGLSGPRNVFGLCRSGLSRPRIALFVVKAFFGPYDASAL